MVDPKIVIS
jgi:transposase